MTSRRLDLFGVSGSGIPTASPAHLDVRDDMTTRRLSL
jgi:hypothetical protein